MKIIFIIVFIRNNSSNDNKMGFTKIVLIFSCSLWITMTWDKNNNYDNVHNNSISDNSILIMSLFHYF